MEKKYLSEIAKTEELDKDQMLIFVLVLGYRMISQFKKFSNEDSELLSEIFQLGIRAIQHEAFLESLDILSQNLFQIAPDLDENPTLSASLALDTCSCFYYILQVLKDGDVEAPRRASQLSIESVYKYSIYHDENLDGLEEFEIPLVIQEATFQVNLLQNLQGLPLKENIEYLVATNFPPLY